MSERIMQRELLGQYATPGVREADTWIFMSPKARRIEQIERFNRPLVRQGARPLDTGGRGPPPPPPRPSHHTLERENVEVHSNVFDMLELEHNLPMTSARPTAAELAWGVDISRRNPPSPRHSFYPSALSDIISVSSSARSDPGQPWQGFEDVGFEQD